MLNNNSNPMNLEGKLAVSDGVRRKEERIRSQDDGRMSTEVGNVICNLKRLEGEKQRGRERGGELFITPWERKRVNFFFTL